MKQFRIYTNPTSTQTFYSEGDELSNDSGSWVIKKNSEVVAVIPPGSLVLCEGEVDEEK